jgi:excisionase family DNA binding protein
MKREVAMSFEPLLTLDEVAQILHASRSWVENQIRAGRLKKTKLGGLVRIEPADLRAFIDARKPKPAVEEIVTTLRLEAGGTSSTVKAQVIEEKDR